MTLRITTLSIMTLSITTLSITTLSIMTLSIMTLNIMTLSIMTLGITIRKCNTQHKSTQLNDIKELPRVIRLLSVIMLMVIYAEC
jgi:hypothetical protein